MPDPIYEPDNPDVARAADGHRLTARHREVRKGVNERHYAKRKEEAREAERLRIEAQGGLLLPLAKESPENLPVVAGFQIEPIHWAAFVARALHATLPKAHAWLLAQGYQVSSGNFYQWCHSPWMAHLKKQWLQANQDQFMIGLAHLKEQAVETAGEILAGAREDDKSVNAQSTLIRALMEVGPDPAIDRQKKITINTAVAVGIKVEAAVDLDKMRRELTPDQIARLALPDSEIPVEFRKQEER